MTKTMHRIKQELSSLLGDISNPKYYNSKWINEAGDLTGQFEEDISLLFDNLDLEYLVASKQLRLSGDEWAVLEETLNTLNAVLSNLPDPIQNLDFVHSYQWTLFEENAREASSILGKR